MENTQVSVQILLPKSLNQRLARWAKDAPGASWPAWGGHITLVPPFHPLVSFTTLTETVTAVCARHHPMQLRFSVAASVPDWTREGYRAVILKPPTDDDAGVVQFMALQQDLRQMLGGMGLHVKPALLTRILTPHITLALSVSEMEADHMVSQIRSQNLTAEITVDRVWLLQFDGGHNGGTLVQRQEVALAPLQPDDLIGAGSTNQPAPADGA